MSSHNVVWNIISRWWKIGLSLVKNNCYLPWLPSRLVKIYSHLALSCQSYNFILETLKIPSVHIFLLKKVVILILNPLATSIIRVQHILSCSRFQKHANKAYCFPWLFDFHLGVFKFNEIFLNRWPESSDHVLIWTFFFLSKHHYELLVCCFVTRKNLLFSVVWFFLLSGQNELFQSHQA